MAPAHDPGGALAVALSGKPLAKSKCEDGSTVYRLVAEEPARRARAPRVEAPA